LPTIGDGPFSGVSLAPEFGRLA